jgi:tRNA threonylcarbamoyladenosine biosynthesis protein TsaE
VSERTAFRTSGVLPVETCSPEETIACGRVLAPYLLPGDIVALYGEMGTGKTHLVKGVCSAFGIDEYRVRSPTFALVHEYRGSVPVFHFDAYRIHNAGDFFEIGYEGYFFDDGICLIEWPERVETLLPAGTHRLQLEHLGGDRRRIGWVEPE